ncbi:MAG: hydroxymethylbilane synthase [Candidatus Dormiibacterota bacterium]
MIALATRGSALARAQTDLAIAALLARFPSEEFTAVVVDSDGDLSPASLAPDLPGQGWFTSRLELALRSGQVEGAIHSAKDLPTEIGPDVLIAGFLGREDPRDALVSRDGGNLAELAPGARVGTSSPRRSAQLLALRPDLVCDPIRGNVDTRIRKVRDGEFDACVVAMAGLIRLDRAHDGLALDPQLECTPAPAQGAIALQARVGSRFAELAAAIDDRSTRDCVQAERRVLTEMGGGCQLPLGTLAEPLDRERARLTVAWPLAPGEGVRRITQEGTRAELGQLATAMARELS